MQKKKKKNNPEIIQNMFSDHNEMKFINITKWRIQQGCQKQSERKCESLSRVRLSVTPWTVACQAPLSMDSPGKNTGVVATPSPGIFPIQRLNSDLLHCRWFLYHMRHLRSLIRGYKSPPNSL